ncbi:hypothetical protein RHGRI_026833 [Rhododendron griersonianum]|uniref:PB1 domain-containing protein n=1 Tax=Rhododendron griersonianum TaxID=479676 RepID=A0AAV6IWI1_9ERIC|nr:hypothetical protein RHGRI_026833 [Rhododendron griersonianum]
MEPPPPAAAPPLSAPTYPDSLDSSPRSRNTDSWDEPPFPASTLPSPKLRLMCSYGGHIVPRPHDKSLCYVGGDTRIVLTDRYSSLPDLSRRLSKTLLNNQPFTLKYQLPNEDLDSLISVTTDEDLDNMIEEYDRLLNSSVSSGAKSSRLRLFLFPSKPDSIGSLLEDSTKSEDWFVNALNGSSNRGFSESASVNCLLGLDDDDDVSGKSNSAPVTAAGKDGEEGGKGGGVSVHSVPDSPMLETTSSFGSTSSSPSLANLPPIRVHAAATATADDQRLGIEEQFAHLSVVVGAPAAVVPAAAPPAASSPPSGVVAAVGGFSGEYANRVFSDDERSGEGMGFGDGSLTNPLSRQRPVIYQEQVAQNAFPVDPKLSDPNSRVQMQQLQDSGYLLPNQFDLHHQQLQQQQQLNEQHLRQQQLNQQHHQQQQLNQQQQQQLNQQQQQQLNQQNQQQQLNQQQQQQLNQQQFLQAGAHYIHQHPSGPVPVPSYYQIYPPQQQPLHPLDQQYHQSMYYMPTARQAQPYNYVVQQPNYNEAATTNAASSRPQIPPLPSSVMPMPPPSSYTTARNPPASSKPEMATGMYRTAAPVAQPLVQAPSTQHHQQYVGFTQIHHPHPSQSAAPNSGNTGAYAYEFVDPAQMYYPQAMASQLAAQYQTMTSGPAMALQETSTQLPADNTKQQIRTSQP